jgi:hypothetical protein
MHRCTDAYGYLYRTVGVVVVEFTGIVAVGCRLSAEASLKGVAYLQCRS